MGNPLADLLGIIREEIIIYRELIEHMREKTALLVQGRLEAILDSNRVEEAFSAQLRRLEIRMARLSIELSGIYKIPREEFTLLKLADSVDQSLAAEIKSQTVLFGDLLEQLKLVSQRNMLLVEQWIRYSRSLLNFLANATSSYKETGLFKPMPAVQPMFSHRA